ncbi:MAG: hypothetical protein ACJ71B_13545 [Nitrososphaera sp.]
MLQDSLTFVSAEGVQQYFFLFVMEYVEAPNTDNNLAAPNSNRKKKNQGCVRYRLLRAETTKQKIAFDS